MLLICVLLSHPIPSLYHFFLPLHIFPTCLTIPPFLPLTHSSPHLISSLPVSPSHHSFLSLIHPLTSYPPYLSDHPTIPSSHSFITSPHLISSLPVGPSHHSFLSLIHPLTSPHLTSPHLTSYPPYLSDHPTIPPLTSPHILPTCTIPPSHHSFPSPHLISSLPVRPSHHFFLSLIHPLTSYPPYLSDHPTISSSHSFITSSHILPTCQTIPPFLPLTHSSPHLISSLPV